MDRVDRPCKNKGCKNIIPASRTGLQCSPCYVLSWKKRNPLKNKYQTLRQRAKEVNLEFTLTFEEFKGLVKGTDYATADGRKEGGWMIVRVDKTKIYSIDNIELRPRTSPKNQECITPGCTRKQKNRSLTCGTCQIRKWRKNHPLKYKYQGLRTRAKRRKIKFELTFEHFCEIVKDTDYLKEFENRADQLTIDRIEEDKGYVNGNIQLLPHGENSTKGLMWRHHGTNEYIPEPSVHKLDDEEDFPDELNKAPF